MEELEQIIEEILSKYNTERENLVVVLQEIQDRVSYISKDTMIKVADFFNISPVDVYSIVSFYKKFRRKPLGKFPITVCLGTACYLTGGELILSAFERELNIKVDDVTEDGMFSLEKASCFGCCNMAPVIKIKEKIYPKMTPGKVEEVIINLKDEISNS